MKKLSLPFAIVAQDAPSSNKLDLISNMFIERSFMSLVLQINKDEIELSNNRNMYFESFYDSINKENMVLEPDRVANALECLFRVQILIIHALFFHQQ